MEDVGDDPNVEMEAEVTLLRPSGEYEASGMGTADFQAALLRHLEVSRTVGVNGVLITCAVTVILAVVTNIAYCANVFGKLEQQSLNERENMDRIEKRISDDEALMRQEAIILTQLSQQIADEEKQERHRSIP